MRKKTIFLFLICCLPIPALFAQMPPDEIVRKVDEARSPQIDYTMTVEVTSFSPRRKPKSATYDVIVKGSDKTIIKTILPEVERNRILLMRDNDLWAFFPEVSKPLRLSLQERLIGEVANGDIARVNFSGDYNANLLRIEKIGQKNYYVLELTAKTPAVTYGKAILWAEKESFWPFKAEFYAISGRLLKTCSYEEYKMLGDRLRPTQLVMEDPVFKGKKSIIKYTNIQIGEIPEKFFSKDYMKKQDFSEKVTGQDNVGVSLPSPWGGRRRAQRRNNPKEIASLPSAARNETGTWIDTGARKDTATPSDTIARKDTTARDNISARNNAFFRPPQTGVRKTVLKQEADIRSELASRISEPQDLTKFKTQFLLSETGKLSDNASFKVSGRFYYDAVYDITDNLPESVESDQEKEVELRDTYIDYSNGPFDLRMGKQQIVWGEAVGLFFADAVNAKDLREFVLPDFNMIRIPQWGADFEYAKEDFHAEFVWLPVLEFNKLGETGSEFAFPYPVPENTSFSTQDPNRPKNTFKNSATGTRLSYLFNGWDLSAFYLYTWDQFPVMYRAIEAGAYRFYPQRKRQNITGVTFSKEISGIVYKGEFVFNPKGYFSIFDNSDSDGITRKDYIDYLLGIDKTIRGIDINFQFMQRVIFNYDSLLVNEKETRNSVSFRANKGFLDNNLDVEFLIISSLMEKDLLYRPKLTYNFKNNWKFRFGLDIFQGHSSGIFGKFHEKNRVYSEISYTF